MNNTRRDFLMGTAWMGAAALAAGCVSDGLKLTSGGTMQGFAAPAYPNGVRVGVIGLGARGHWAMQRLAQIPGCEVTAICDINPERLDINQKWLKENGYIRSYEWIRYASLPGIRVIGGMGKLLDAFVEYVKPDDVMSYADLEWSDGEVYRTLGFEQEGVKEPVMFAIDPSDWSRTALKPPFEAEGKLFYMNFGSLKYRKKYTEL